MSVHEHVCTRVPVMNVNEHVCARVCVVSVHEHTHACVPVCVRTLPLPSPKNLDLTGFTGLLSKDSVPGPGELSVEGHLCLLPLPFPSSST